MLRKIVWLLIALAGAAGWAALALHRGETISAAWLVLAAVGTSLFAFRFYSRFLADRVFGLNDRRATPAERLANGRDYVPTGRWVLFGHHFAAIAVLAIMVILLAVLALVVVNALRDSPWGVFTILCTIPIAFLMGYWMKVWRPGKTLEASAFGVALLMLALVGGRYVAESATLAPLFTHSAPTIAYAVIAYGFI